MLSLESNIDFFRAYTQKVHSSYDKPGPRPWPCGIVWIHWDPPLGAGRPANARSISRSAHH